MAARKTPSAGKKPDKLMRDAILLELNEERAVESGGKVKKVKKFRLVARAMVDKAIGGDVPAMKEICDRSDGKISPLSGSSDDNGGFDLEKLIHASYRVGKPEAV